jgi:hypothetical protein
MPVRLLIITIVPHIIYNAIALVFFALIGKAGLYLRAKIDAVRHITLFLHKRKQIQEKKRVTDKYIWNLLDNEFFIDRLIHRLFGKQLS